VARPREFDTDEAIGNVADVFWAKGYEATSVSNLEEATGLARPRLYAAFGSKQEMLYKSIAFYLSNEIERVLQMVEGGGVEGISDWFRRFGVVRERLPERAQMGCLMVNTMVELGDTDQEVLALGDRYLKRVAGVFRTALETSAARGEFEGDIEERVDLATLLLIGLFVSVRSGTDVARIRRLSRAAADQVDSWRVVAVG
jgi:TetR/AcrR family transcriptional repressor of nem operon